MAEELPQEEAEFLAFRLRFLTRAATAVLAVCGVLMPAMLLGGFAHQVIFPALGSLMMVGCIHLVRQERLEEAGMVFALAAIVSLGAFDFSDADDNGIGTGMMLVTIFMSAMVLTERAAIVTTVLVCASFVLGEHNQYAVKGIGKVIAVFFECGSAATACYVSVLFMRRQAANRVRARERREQLAATIAAALHVASGQLGREVTGGDEASKAIREMQRRLRNAVADLRNATTVLSPVSKQIGSMAESSRRLADHQTEAVGQTRRLLEHLARSADGIASSADSVLGNADATTAANAEVTERLHALADAYAQIEALLARIRGVAQKSEVLALNASLEGIRAGDAGRGFSLIANEMQSLAEQVRIATVDTGVIFRDIQAAAQQATQTFQISNEQAEETRKTARKITRATRQQRAATQQLLGAIGELEQSSGQLMTSSEETIASVEHLRELSGELIRSLDHWGATADNSSG